MAQVLVECLSAYLEYTAVHGDLSRDFAIVRPKSYIFHSLVFPDFRQLAAKKSTCICQQFIFFCQSSYLPFLLLDFLSQCLYFLHQIHRVIGRLVSFSHIETAVCRLSSPAVKRSDRYA